MWIEEDSLGTGVVRLVEIEPTSASVSMALKKAEGELISEESLSSNLSDKVSLQLAIMVECFGSLSILAVEKF